MINFDKIKSAEDLVYTTRKDLVGKKLSDITNTVYTTDGVSRVSSKAGVGYVIEEGYFGISKNSSHEPDISYLNVEVKTCPIKIGRDGKFRVKEPLSLNIINYTTESENTSITESSLYLKNKNILFIIYLHEEYINRSEYKIKYVFLWEIDEQVLKDLEPDYKIIVKKIKEGRAHEIHQKDNIYLTLCPKHGGHFKDPNCKKSKTKQPYSDIPAEIRAFRLKNKYMNLIIRRYLLKNDPKAADDFISC